MTAPLNERGAVLAGGGRDGGLRGRAENERRLAAELARTGVRGAVTAAHARLVPLNREFGAACTDWQVRPTRADPIALNDHADWRWDDRVLRRLAALDASFGQLCDQLTGCLERFGGYGGRYSAALRQAEAGQRAWVDAPDRDSCHIAWMQFHEDLLATLGLPRGSDALAVRTTQKGPWIPGTSGSTSAR
jgi:hypothetical protein